MTERSPAGVLQGIRVVEWGAFHIGPAAATMLADLGAEVIKVEEPGKGDPMRGVHSIFGLSTLIGGGRTALIEDLNRGKKSISLNLKHPKGRETMLALLARADVFVTNHLPGSLRKMGMDYETVRSVNPRLIYASASAYGREGPEADVAGLEAVLEAKAGISMSCGEPDTPPTVFVGGVADRCGAVYLAYGVLAALLGRERFGVAQEAWTSGLGALIALQSPAASVVLTTGKRWPRLRTSEFPNPLYSQFCCKDGRWLVFGAVPEDRYWRPFCEVLGVPELVDDPRFATGEERAKNAAECRIIIEAILASRPAYEWESAFVKARVICSVAKTLDEALSDPQAVANQYVVDYEHPALGRNIKMLGFPVQLSETPARIQGCAPEVGQHTEEVLTEILGRSWADIERMRTDGVI